MPADLRIVVPNRPGVLTSALAALAREGLTVDGASGDLRPGERWGYLHLLVDDGDRASKTLEAQGIEVTSLHDVDVVELEQHPGALVELLQKYAENDENVEVFYMASKTRWVIGTENMRRDVLGVRMKDARS